MDVLGLLLSDVVLSAMITDSASSFTPTFCSACEYFLISAAGQCFIFFLHASLQSADLTSCVKSDMVAQYSDAASQESRYGLYS